jgi:hypothetical protein
MVVCSGVQLVTTFALLRALELSANALAEGAAAPMHNRHSFGIALVPVALQVVHNSATLQV